MYKKLTDDIWFGDKASVEETLGEVKSIINVAHSLRRPYWKDLQHLHWDVWYYRLALPDRVAADTNYMHAFQNILRGIKQANKFPLLCHCRAGGHRGPTAALFAAWYINGRRDLGGWIEKIKVFNPKFDAFPNRRVYRQSILRYCRKIEAKDLGTTLEELEESFVKMVDAVCEKCRETNEFDLARAESVQCCDELWDVLEPL